MQAKIIIVNQGLWSCYHQGNEWKRAPTSQFSWISVIKTTVGAQIFVGTIFHMLNFHGDKFFWVVVAHENLTPRKIVVHETGMARCEEDVEYQKTLCDKAINLHYRRWGYPRWQWTIRIWQTIEWTHFWSAIVEVQACVRTVTLYVANYSLAQFFVGLIFVGNARPRKLNSHENFCIYGITDSRLTVQWFFRTAGTLASSSELVVKTMHL